MNATSTDVARRAGVSRGAVSQILNGRGERFAPATRVRVLEAARALAYEPSSAARTLARGRSDVVVVVVPNTTFGAHLQDIFDVLTNELSEAGLTLVTCYSTASIASFDRFIAGLRPVAVVPMAELGAAHLEVLTKRGALVVGSSAPAAARPDANDDIGAIQAQHLFERGHRRLAYAHLTDGRENVYGYARLQGFQGRCAELGVAVSDVIGVSIDAEAAAGQLRRLDGPGIAVACYNDDVALTLLACGRRLGWEVPAGLALIGVDNTPLTRVLSPRLTTIAYDASAIAQRLAQGVLMTLGQGQSGPTEPLEFEVVQGETT